MNYLKLALTLPLVGPSAGGTTRPARRTAISAPGHLMFLTSRFLAEQFGNFRASGPTQLTTAPRWATPTAAVKKVVWTDTSVCTFRPLTQHEKSWQQEQCSRRGL